MHGNVWEWCWDKYKLYSLMRVHDWDDFLQFVKPERRVLRGGSFRGPPGGLRSANRVGFWPVGRGTDNGFRCVRVPPAFS
jgi:formylglycine-generating enzyme required for sulfatase activity